MAVDLLTNHGHALVCLARNPDMRLRDIADCVGVTERSAQQIVCDLEGSGYLTRRRVGRRNVYEIHSDVALPHDLESDSRVLELLKALRAKPVEMPSS
jgi:hypothetical protein